ncbi:hypothetical protein V8D89_011204 [Ganoderma adspersum]
MAPFVSRLLDIPEDIRIHILFTLDTVSLLRCKRLCRDIRNLIDNTVELEYKLALARAGRVERGQSRLCIVDRLRALESLRTTRFSLDTLPFILLSNEINPHRPGVTDGFIPYLTNNSSDLVLWRPSFPSRDAPEEKRHIPAVMSPQVPATEIGTLAVDIAQDLLVFSRSARPDINPPECYVYSMSEGRPHSAAGPEPLKIDFEPVFVEDGFNTIEDLQIFGDVIAWSITDDRHSAVHVWNWKTSVLVWHRQSDIRGSSCRVISPSHVVLVTAQAVSVFEFDSAADHPPEPATLEGALCVLELPALTPAPFAPYVRTYMQFPPSVPTPAQPPTDGGDPGVAFGLDPALTVLTITLLLSVSDVHGRVGSDFRYAIFVPLSTLRARIEAASPHLGAFADTDTDTDADTGLRTVPWAEWGPRGTRIVRFSHISHISVMGSRCAFMRQEEGHSGELHVVLFDVRRGVGDDTTGERLENLNVYDDGFDAAEALGPTSSFAEEIRTTFPVEVEHQAYSSMLSGYLLQDAIAMSCQACGAQGALGWRWYDRWH